MPSGPQSKLKAILVEGLIVALAGLAFGLLANQLNPNGISLTRNYFGISKNTPGNPLQTATATNQPTATNALVQSDLLKKLQEKGLQLGDSNQVYKLYNDPRYAMDLVIFIDARDDKSYSEGHIPGAYQLDYYKPEKYLADVLPVCPIAEQIVIYCTGGDCEDSQFTALLLSGQAGVPKEKILIYGGGIHEWTANRWPIEIGARKSGTLRSQPAASTGGAK